MNADTLSPIDHLHNAQTTLHELVSAFDEYDCRNRFHPDLSPPGWHLGHTLFVENFWLRETILGKYVCRRQHQLYWPQNTKKSARGAHLPPRERLLEDCLEMQRDNLGLLSSPPRRLASHHMMNNDYLTKFLVQHHAMHLEALHMCLTERQLRKKDRFRYLPEKRLVSENFRMKPVTFDGCTFEIGGNSVWCFDNESPRHKKTLPAFSLNASKTSNAEFLGFIENGGYDNPEWWDAAGWLWLRKSRARAPHHWLQSKDGAWFGADSHGYHDLVATDPVYGLSHHEARAFACYAGARLPHENEWEMAHACGLAHEDREDSRRCAWEWCANGFYPYPGFKPYPYTRYSVPWFDNRHYSLRGHSRHTSEVLRRITFRNFYSADKRHIFAGVRVAMSR